jgi:hypothetical protein
MARMVCSPGPKNRRAVIAAGGDDGMGFAFLAPAIAAVAKIVQKRKEKRDTSRVDKQALIDRVHAAEGMKTGAVIGGLSAGTVGLIALGAFLLLRKK